MKSRHRGTRVPAAALPGRCLTAYHPRSEEHTSELQSRFDLVCRLLLEKKNDTGEGNPLTAYFLLKQGRFVCTDYVLDTDFTGGCNATADRDLEHGADTASQGPHIEDFG